MNDIDLYSIQLADMAPFLNAARCGSVIDTAKAIARGAANPGVPLWDIWTKKVPLTRSHPVGAVLTMPAAGSEMSDSAVLTNEAVGKKAGIDIDFNRCRFAVMDPALGAAEVEAIFRRARQTGRTVGMQA